MLSLEISEIISDLLSHHTDALHRKYHVCRLRAYVLCCGLFKPKIFRILATYSTDTIATASIKQPTTLRIMDKWIKWIDWHSY